MIVVDLAEDYLVFVSTEIKNPSRRVKDPKEGMRKLTASYLILMRYCSLKLKNKFRADPARAGKRKGHRNNI